MIKAGDYIRTKTGFIAKVINVNDYREPTMRYCVEANYLKHEQFVGDEDIQEVAKSPENLIKEHDVLVIGYGGREDEICEVQKLYDPMEKRYFLGVCLKNEKAKHLYEVRIKRIITKERFERIGFEV